MVMQSENQRSAEEAGQAALRFERARQLLAGLDSDSHLLPAIADIDSASADGCGEATALRAVFEAMGVARPRNWDKALDCLALAAQQGSNAAGRQLTLLADRSRDPVLPADPPPGHWAGLRGQVSLDRLLEHGPRVALSNSPRIRVIEGFASPPECRWLIERMRTRLKPALVFNSDGTHSLDQSRTNTGREFLVCDMDLVVEVIRNRVSAATRVPVTAFEASQVLHYDAGQQFALHIDSFDTSNPMHHEQLRSRGQRIATFLIYLNDGFEGGETDFPRAGVRYRGKIGDAIFWTNVDTDGIPDPMSLHAGLPPTSGEKWVLSQWIRDRELAAPQRP